MRTSSVTNQIRALREADPRQSQQALADAVGVSRQTIIAIESGRYTPSLDLALRLARHFDMTVEQIFTLNEDP